MLHLCTSAPGTVRERKTVWSTSVNLVAALIFSGWHHTDRHGKPTRERVRKERRGR